MIKILFTWAFAILFSFVTLAQNSVTVDFNKIVKENVRKGGSSANLCWLLDSDLKRPNQHQSMKQALSEVGVGALRFPYGHLADNYLWHAAPYDNMENGLRPKVAAMSRPPSKWSWAVKSDASFKHAMDFDEFMDLCQTQNIVPLVVVNLLSFKYDGGPTIEELATSAAEWVKYAKKKGYKVAYWQIGNEIDHHPKTITLSEFIEAYKTIASAMKAVDPSANIGPGILGKQKYFTALYEVAPDLVDFTSCHQYMFPFIESCKTYDLWSKSNQVYISNVLKMQRAVERTGEKNMEILITETGVSPSGKDFGNVSNTYKALWWFEVLMSELMVPNVSYSFFWGTHSPWKGEVDDDKDDVAVMFRLDNNSRKPTAEVSRLVNSNLKDQFVESSTTSDALRVFSMLSKNKEEGTIFIMNKLKTSIPVSLNLINAPADVKELDVVVLSGKGPFVKKMVYKENGVIGVKAGKALISIPPLSIYVLRYGK